MTDTGLVLLVGLAAIFGLLIGSFLNVVIIREPQGLSVVRPRSSCPGCGTPIAGRDNIPVLSWLLLRGRARCCGTPISARYLLVEGFTGVAFGLTAALVGPSWRLPALLYLIAIAIPLTAIDVATKRLPNVIILPAYPISAALLTLAAVAEGEPGRLLRAAICGAVLYAFYFVLMAVHPGGMGFGDVKLAGILGLYLGFFGWEYAAVGLFLGFGVGGVVGIALMLGGLATRKTAIPFGPYMIVGAFLALAVAAPLTDWYLGAAGL